MAKSGAAATIGVILAIIAILLASLFWLFPVGAHTSTSTSVTTTTVTITTCVTASEGNCIVTTQTSTQTSTITSSSLSSSTSTATGLCDGYPICLGTINVQSCGFIGGGCDNNRNLTVENSGTTPETLNLQMIMCVPSSSGACANQFNGQVSGSITIAAGQTANLAPTTLYGSEITSETYPSFHSLCDSADNYLVVFSFQSSGLKASPQITFSNTFVLSGSCFSNNQP